MTLVDAVVRWGWVAFALGGWVLYFRELQRSRDYLADLMQTVHDYDLDRDDLRRSLNWSEVEDYLD